LKHKWSNAVKVKHTQRAIKHVLTERWYAWEDARLLAERDASVNLYPEEGEPAYNAKMVDYMVCHAMHQYSGITDTLHRSSKSPKRLYQHNKTANCLYQMLKHKCCLSRPEHSKRRGSKLNLLYLYYNQVYYDKLYNKI